MSPKTAYANRGPHRGEWDALGLLYGEVDVRPSMGSVGNAYENAFCENFCTTFECDFFEHRTFRIKADARMATFDFIEGFYNPYRRHSALEYLSPVRYEEKHLSAA